MPQKTLAEIITILLKKHEISDVFFLSGSTNYEFLNTLQQNQFKTHFFPHEQSLIHAATGYSFVTGRPSVIVVSSGPGISNTITGLLDTLKESHQILLICGDIYSNAQSDFFFQFFEAKKVLSSVTKNTIQLNDTATIIKDLLFAFYSLTTRPFGPTSLIIPTNYWTKKLNYEIPLLINENKHEVNSKNIDYLLSKVSNSKKLSFLVTKDCNSDDIISKITKLSNELSIALVVTPNGLCTINKKKSKNYFGVSGRYGDDKANNILKSSTMIFVFGQKLINRDLPEDEHNKNNKYILINDSFDTDFQQNPHYISIKCSFDLFLNELRKIEPNKNEIDYRIKWLKDNLKIRDSKTSSMWLNKYKHLFKCLNQSLHKKDLVVTDCGLHQVATFKLLKLKSNNNGFLTTSHFGVMGFGLPAAIGASLSKIKRKIWLIVGDGGFLASIHNLSIIKNVKNLVILIINDHGYGMLREQQIHKNNYLTDFNFSWKLSSITKGFGIKTFSIKNQNITSNLFETTCLSEESVIIEIIY